MGKCPACGEWNTFTEEIISTKTISGAGKSSTGFAVPFRINEIVPEKKSRLNTGIEELNRVLGGGVVSGSVVLIGGEPGIGKSTLALQLAMSMDNYRILYVSGEESAGQIKMRAERLNVNNENCYILNEISIDRIFIHLENLKPDILIADSVQTLQDENLESSPGSITQIRECSGRLMKFAKETGTPVFLIGHITKDGVIAGPKILEHIVDTVLLFEGDQQFMFRLLRATKNRFGATSELGIFEMLHEGLREVSDPSEVLVNKDNEGLGGIAVAATIDGIRPFMIEVQALVSTAAYGMPQRVASGYDVRKLNMLLAVLERKAKFRLAVRDVFLNLAGGLRVTDPALDLAVISAILSSAVDRNISKKMCFSAEIGLSGEIRPVSRIDQRIREAERLGYKGIMISASHQQDIVKSAKNIEVVRVSKVEDAVKILFR